MSPYDFVKFSASITAPPRLGPAGIEICVSLRKQLVVARNVFFVFRLPALRTHVDPLEFALHRFAPFAFTLFFQRKTRFFLLKPARIIAFKRITFAAVEFQNPTGHVVEKITVVRDRDDRTLVIVQMLFKPRDRFRVQVVRRFVEQKDIGLLQKQPAQRNAPALTAGKHVDDLISRRTTQRFHSEFQIRIEIPRIERVEFFLQLRLPCAEFVEIRVGISERFVYCIEFRKEVGNLFDALADDFPDRFAFFELRLLFEIADRIARREMRFARKLRIASRKYFKQTRFTRSVRPDDADLCTVIIRNADIFQNDFRAVRSAHTVHRVDDFFIVNRLCHTHIISEKNESCKFSIAFSDY